MRERLTRRRGIRSRPSARVDVPDAVFTDIAARQAPVVQICHPDWMGVRTAAHAFRDPVIESPLLPHDLAQRIASAGASTVVVHAAPPGTPDFLARASDLGLTTCQVFHSSMAQHGTDAGEAESLSTAIAMAADGSLDRLGFVKAGMAEVFSSRDTTTFHVPNRVPVLPELERVPLSDHPSFGVFLDPYWRKNVMTQLGAVHLLDGTAHVMHKPAVPYIETWRIVEHGSMPWTTFVSLQASVDINLYVTLSECQPMAPMESYLAGVPCLISATSDLFATDRDLRRMTTVADHDNPAAIAAGVTSLIEGADDAIVRAQSWMIAHDPVAAARWSEFTRS